MGTVTVDPDAVRTLLQLPGTPPRWALWDGAYIRIRDISITAGGTGLLRVDQSVPPCQLNRLMVVGLPCASSSPHRHAHQQNGTAAERGRALADHHAATAARRTL